MYLCYIDESGTSDIPGNTSHFVLAGISIPVYDWKQFEAEVTKLKKRLMRLNRRLKGVKNEKILKVVSLKLWNM